MVPDRPIRRNFPLSPGSNLVTAGESPRGRSVEWLRDCR
jgi:hypothetical protein